MVQARRIDVGLLMRGALAHGSPVGMGTTRRTEEGEPMSITRYAADGQPHHDDRGPWVLYAEHLVAVEALRQAEQMIQALTDELLAKPPEMSMGAQYLAGVAVGQRDERKRSVLLIADAYGKGQRDALANTALINEIRNEQFQKGLEAAVQRVEALWWEPEHYEIGKRAIAAIKGETA
jgi:hypothetical protein